jgi:hypothetical protein
MITVALLLQWLLFAATVALVLGRREASLFHPLALYLIFHGLVFVLRPTAVHALGFDEQWGHMRFTPDEGQFVLTLVVASVGLLAFLGGALLAGQPPQEAATPRPSRLPDPTGAERTAWTATLAVLLPLALFGAYRDAAIFGTFAAPGEAGMVVDPGSAQTYFQNTTAYVVKAHNLLIPIAAITLWLARFRLWAVWPLALVVGYRVYLGSRWGMVLALGVALLLLLHRRGLKWPPLRMAVLALPLLAGFHVVGENRDLLRNALGVGESRYEQTARNWPRGLDKWDTPSFANFDFLAYIVAVVPEHSRTYTYFTQHLELFTRPVPRVLWPDKPRGPPVQLVDLNAYGWFGTRTVSLVGDGWRSAGWLGVVLTCGGVGWLLTRAYIWFARRRDRLFPVALYACYLPTVVLWYRGGEVVNAVRFGVWMTLPVLLWWGLSAVLTHAAAKRAQLAHTGSGAP